MSVRVESVTSPDRFAEPPAQLGADGPLAPLERALQDAEGLSADDLLDRFLAFIEQRGLSLYEAQEEAILEIFAGKHVILNTPTGSGKSLVATAMAFRTLANAGRFFYTCPIKALVSEKFFSFCDDFGAQSVGMMTGDATVNRDAPIICCTAEILSNMALHNGDEVGADAVVMDEFHYFGDRERGVAWEVPLLTLSRTVFMLMTATLGDATSFQKHLGRGSRECALVTSTKRPVPLDFEYRLTALHQTVKDLIKENRHPIYIVNFTQRACAEEAQNLMSENYCSKEEKAAIVKALDGVKFDTPYGKEIQKFVRHGIGLHHAGLLPKYRLLVEKLAQKGHLKIICGTDTLGVGVNIPIRSVLFTKLCKFDGESDKILGVREFHQIAGRAGRKGFDEQGSVVAQAPPHVIENVAIDRKKAEDPKRYKKLQRAKPPNKGYVRYDKTTFDKLVESPAESLRSQFSVSHGMLIHILQSPDPGPRGGYGRLLDLCERSFISDREKRIQKRLAKNIFQALRTAEVIEVLPKPNGRPGRVVSISAGLQDDFSLNQTLSLYLFEALSVLDPESPSYALDVMSMVEAVLENPRAILQQQLNKKKADKVAELKAAGVEYDERMAELEKVDIDKPNAELIYETYNAFSKAHPWLAQEAIRPKSVAREMFEQFRSFRETIREFSLQRVEGSLLRYLTDAYKTMVQSVPEAMKTAEVNEIIDFLGDEVRNVDSSLIDAWESLMTTATPEHKEPSKPIDLFADKKALTIRVRKELHRLIGALSRKDYEEAATLIVQDDQWDAPRLEEAMEPYFAKHNALLVHHAARRAEYTHLRELDVRSLSAWQTLVDPEGECDWSVEVLVTLNEEESSEHAAAAGEGQRPIIRLIRISD